MEYMKQHKKPFVIAGGIVVAILVIMLAVTGMATRGDKILKNVYVDSVNLSGLTKEEAKTALDDYVIQIENTKLTFKAGQKTKTMSAENAGITYDEDTALKEAYGVGRNGNLFSNFVNVCKLKGSVKKVPLKAVLTEDQAETVLKNIEKQLICKTKNASLTRKNGKFVIKKEVIGQTIDYGKSVKTIEKMISEQWNKKDETIPVSVKKEKPEYTAKDLKEIKDVLGTYTTSYSSSSYNRKRNVENGAGKINGTMLYPGDQLSVYKTVSPFTAETGYYLAPSYASGKVVQTYGGGICQVSTTLYNAVLRAELDVKERSNHSMTVHYVPLSADAAIAGTSKDLKFVNNQKTPVYIEGAADGGSLRFTIYGKETRDKNRKVSFESKTISVRNPGTVEKKDPSLLEGKTQVVSGGSCGYVAQLWKVVTVKGKEVERTRVNTSSYNSTPRTVLVGTKKPATTEKPEDKPGKTTEKKEPGATTATTPGTQAPKPQNGKKTKN